MIVYGVALLSACLILGMIIGEALGVALGVEANVGGVGIAMLFLVLASNSDTFKALVDGASGTGIQFWSAMYIPIVVAMAARQNVVAAFEGGMLAVDLVFPGVELEEHGHASPYLGLGWVQSVWV